MSDQYDHVVKLSSYSGKPVLLIYGDRKGGDYIGSWSAAVKAETAATGAKVIPIADLKAVPGFLHGYVKKKFLARRPNGDAAGSVLLDWDGWIATHYGYRENLANVYLVNAQGVLVFSGAGEGKPEETRPLAEALKRLPAAEKSRNE